MRRFFRPYYLLNAALLASYVATRRLYLDGATEHGRISGAAALSQWEWRVAGVLALAMGIHGLKVRTTLRKLVVVLHAVAVTEYLRLCASPGPMFLAPAPPRLHRL